MSTQTTTNTKALEASFLAAVEASGGVVTKLAQVYTSDAHEAQDLQQEMLLQAWRAYPTFEGRSAFSTWLYRLCTNVALTWTRTVSRRNQREQQFAERTRGDTAFVTPAEPPRSPAAELLYTNIKGLQTVDRSLITMNLDGYSNTDIAEVLGISSGAVATRISRIRTRLQKSLNPTHN